MASRTRSVVALGVMVGGLVTGCGPSQGHEPVPVFAAAEGAPRSVAASLHTPRHEMTATAIGPDAVLVAGGETLHGVATDTAEVFEVGSGRSRPLGARLTQPRAGHGAVALSGGRVLLVGGRDASGRPLATLEVFDPIEERFEALPRRLERPRHRAAVAALGSRVVVACGEGEDSLEVWSLQAGGPVARMDALPGGPRAGAQLVPAGGDLLLLYGGVGPEGERPCPVWIDLAAKRATEVLERVPQDATCVRLSPDAAEVALIGGVVVEPWGDEDASRRFVLLRPGAAPSHSELGPFDPRLRRCRPVCVVGERGVHVFGGEGRTGPLATAERHDLELGSEPLPPLRGARTAFAGVLLPDQTIALVGGLGADGRPSALVDLVIPAGAAGPDAALAFDAVRDAEAASRQLDADLAHSDAERAAAEGELADLTARRAAAEQAIARTRDRIARTEAALTQARSDLQAAQAQGAATAPTLAQRQAQVAQLEAQLQQLQRELASLQAEIAALRG